MTTHIDLNDGWLFTPVWSEAFGRGDAAEAAASDALTAAMAWQSVRLPHTCRETPYDYFDESTYQMICGYRRVIDVPRSWRGQKVLLTVGAAGHSAEVYMNGRFVKSHHCGYTAFTVDLSDELRYGIPNTLAIRVNSREDQDIPPFGYVIDYMTYGGLYREVSLDIKAPAYLEDVFAKPEIKASSLIRAMLGDKAPIKELDEEAPQAGRIESEITIGGELDIEGRELFVRQSLLPYPAEGETEAVIAEKSQALYTLKSGIRTWHGEGHIIRVLEMEAPEIRLWSLDHPALYTLRTELLSVHTDRPKTALTAVHKALRGQRAAASEAAPAGLFETEWDADEVLIDSRTDVIGFRTVDFRKEGFYLNGHLTKLIGLNRHQSYPYVGYAMPASQQKLDADIMKRELGLNAARTSHYPQSPHFLDRCDEIGLLVFTEAPGWQHIGESIAWREQAVRNVEDMVLQNRNHPSVILWGVRINESVDDDELYEKTNKAARTLDPTRPTSGVRCYKKSRLLEDVYAYNDFSHDGTNAGCEKKKAVTGDPDKAYFVSEYNGHMFPAKIFDNEAIRTEHAIRHATVMDAVLSEEDIAGLFGWCLFDYNTHRDFGSGDRICYHGVLDMYRNPKLAAAVYKSQQDDEPVLEVSSLMAMGEHPSGNPGKAYIFTNADEVRFFKNDRPIAVFTPKMSSFKALRHPPILIDHYVSDEMEEKEAFTASQAADVKALLDYAAVYGFSHLPPAIMAKAAKMMVRYRMTFEDAYRLYGTYVGSWGKAATVYRFEAYKGGELVKTLVRSAATDLHLEAEADHTALTEGATYDAALVRLTMRDQNGAVLPFYHGNVRASVTGPLELIGPKDVTLRGGCGGVYVRTTGREGEGLLTLTNDQADPVTVRFEITRQGGDV